MKKFINHPEKITSELLEGMALAHADIISVEQGNLVVNKKLPQAERVTVVTFGGTGHEPAVSGFVGEGMADIAVVGDVFATPGPAACVEAIKLADKGHGVLLVVQNHVGDVLTANLVMKQAERLGMQIAKVVAQENIIGATREEAVERGTLLGIVPLLKIAGAAAAEGKTLEEVTTLVQKCADNMASIALLTGTATNPATDAEVASAGLGTMRFGVDQDGAGGTDKARVSADEVAELLVQPLLDDLNVQAEEKLLVLISGMGATTLMEQLLVYRACHNILTAKQIEVAASFVGDLFTLQEAGGLQVLLARVDEELLACWQAPCRTPYYKN